MKRNPRSENGALNPRILLAFVLCSLGVGLGLASISKMGQQTMGAPESRDYHEGGDRDRLERYMPIPGGDADDLDRMEIDWHNRLTYPTGRFDPRGYVRQLFKTLASRSVSPREFKRRTSTKAVPR